MREQPIPPITLDTGHVIVLTEERRQIEGTMRRTVRGSLHGLPLDREIEIVDATLRAIRSFPLEDGMFRFRYLIDVYPRCWDAPLFGIGLHIVDLNIERK